MSRTSNGSSEQGHPGDDGHPGEGPDAEASGPGGQPAGAPDADRASRGEGAPPKPPKPMTQQIGRIAILVLAVLFGVFAVANSQPVDFSWIVGETLVDQTPAGDARGGVPLILLLLAAFAFGAAIGALTVWQFVRTRRARRAARREQR